jgi:hypothetical protein
MGPFLQQMQQLVASTFRRFCHRTFLRADLRSSLQLLKLGLQYNPLAGDPDGKSKNPKAVYFVMSESLIPVIVAGLCKQS